MFKPKEETAKPGIDLDAALDNMKTYLKSKKIKGYTRMHTPIMSSCADSTIKGQQELIRTLNRKYGIKFEEAWVNEARERMEEEQLKPGSIKEYLTAIENLFTANGHPLMLAKPRRTDKTKSAKYLTEDDILRIIRATTKVTADGRIKHTRDYAMLYTLWGTGCRANELLAIRVNDFETVGGKGKITIHDTKNKHERIVPIPDACTAALNEWKAERRDSDIDDEEFPDLFISSIDGSGLSYAMLRDMVKRYGRIAGLDVHAHAFRHARCSHLLNVENVPPVVVQAMMGHSRLETTMGYCHTGFDDMARYIW